MVSLRQYVFRKRICRNLVVQEGEREKPMSKETIRRSPSEEGRKEKRKKHERRKEKIEKRHPVPVAYFFMRKEGHTPLCAGTTRKKKERAICRNPSRQSKGIKPRTAYE